MKKSRRPFKLLKLVEAFLEDREYFWVEVEGKLGAIPLKKYTLSYIVKHWKRIIVY